MKKKSTRIGSSKRMKRRRILGEAKSEWARPDQHSTKERCSGQAGIEVGADPKRNEGEAWLARRKF